MTCSAKTSRNRSAATGFEAADRMDRLLGASKVSPFFSPGRAAAERRISGSFAAVDDAPETPDAAYIEARIDARGGFAAHPPGKIEGLQRILAPQTTPDHVSHWPHAAT
jgi:hypothetical protein